MGTRRASGAWSAEAYVEHATGGARKVKQALASDL